MLERLLFHRSRLFVIRSGLFLAEEGTHCELLDKSGIYAEMYRNQQSWYAEEAAPA